MSDVSVPTEHGDPAASDWLRMPALRGPSARSYLLIVLGECAIDQSDGIWTQTVVDALGLVGFDEKAARQALTRSTAAGWLVSERRGRKARWRLTDSGRALLLSAKTRLFSPGPEPDWDGTWLMLLTTVPENHRKLRHHLRSALGWVGFGSPGPGLWINPHPSRAEETRQVLRSLGDQVQGTLLHARLDDPEERHRLVDQAWDLTGLDAQYRSFIEHFAAVRSDSSEEALAQLVHMIYQWRRLLLSDPGLPPALLPEDWSGERARRLLLDRREAWHQPAVSWWQQREQESSVPRA